MYRKHDSLFRVIAIVLFCSFQVTAITSSSQGPGGGNNAAASAVAAPVDTTRSLSAYFTPGTPGKKAPDPKGFIQRWLVLEPIKKDITRNNILTAKYLDSNLAVDNFSDDFMMIPKDRSKIKVKDQDLQWHALDSKLFNFKLYRFAWAINKPQNGVVFWLVTVINCPEEIKNVRMAAGCNSAGRFWLNGKEVLTIPGDKDLVVDYSTSTRITLNKGKNIIRAAVVNGPGMIDFCMRFLDDKLQPLKNFTTSFE